MQTRLEPKLVTVLREGYMRKQFTSDLIAGLIGGIVALPLAIAFAIASGVKPEPELYTAVIAGLVIGVLGGTLLLTGVAEQQLRVMEQPGFLEKLGHENVMENSDVALARASIAHMKLLCRHGRQPRLCGEEHAPSPCALAS